MTKVLEVTQKTRPYLLKRFLSVSLAMLTSNNVHTISHNYFEEVLHSFTGCFLLLLKEICHERLVFWLLHSSVYFLFHLLGGFLPFEFLLPFFGQKFYFFFWKFYIVVIGTSFTFIFFPSY